MASSSFAIDVPERCLRELRAGDARAFETVYRLFERPVYTLCLRMLGSREDAQEAMQETFLQLVRHRSEWRADSPFWGWLRRIAVNAALMRLRRQDVLSGSAELDEGDGPEPLALPPEQRVDLDRVLAALAEEPAATRAVMWLYLAEGYTHPEIAELTGQSVSYSKSQLARGLRRVRSRLEPDPSPRPTSIVEFAT